MRYSNLRYSNCYIAARENQVKWLKPFLDKDIGHLSLIYRDLNHTYCMLDPQIHGVQPIVISSIDNDLQLAEWFKSYGYKLIKLPNYNQRTVVAGSPNLFSCVSFIKYCVGIFSFAVTPRQLWKKFIRDGAEILV